MTQKFYGYTIGQISAKCQKPSSPRTKAMYVHSFFQQLKTYLVQSGLLGIRDTAMSKTNENLCLP